MCLGFMEIAVVLVCVEGVWDQLAQEKSSSFYRAVSLVLRVRQALWAIWFAWLFTSLFLCGLVGASR